MSANAGDLWPSDLGPSGQKAPVTILREQGALLGRRTNNLVTARVVPEPKVPSRLRPTEKAPYGPMLPLTPFLSPGAKEPSPQVGATPGSEFRYAFLLVAPALDFYEYKLFTIHHGIGLYPVGLRLEVRGASPVRARNELEFLNVLKKVFSSDHTRRVINSLLEQSQGVEV
jgi:hypothetical protein